MKACSMRYAAVLLFKLAQQRSFEKGLHQCNKSVFLSVWLKKVDAWWLTLVPSTWSTWIGVECFPFRRHHQRFILPRFFLLRVRDGWTSNILSKYFFFILCCRSIEDTGSNMCVSNTDSRTAGELTKGLLVVTHYEEYRMWLEKGPCGGRGALLCTQQKDSLKWGGKFYYSLQL